MDSKKALDILENKLEESKKAYKEMMALLSNSNEPIHLVELCDSYFSKLRDSTDDSLFKKAYFNEGLFEDGEYEGYSILDSLMDNLKEQLRFELTSVCLSMQYTMRKLIEKIKNGKDIHHISDEIEKQGLYWEC